MAIMKETFSYNSQLFMTNYIQCNIMEHAPKLDVCY